MGTVPAGVYGAEVTGLPPKALTHVRATRLRLDGKFLRSALVEEQVVLEKPMYDPGIHAQMAPLHRYHREV